MSHFDDWYLQDTQAIESERQEFATMAIGMDRLSPPPSLIHERIRAVQEECLRLL
jgi:hypothetical protein